jgi:surface protein
MNMIKKRLFLAMMMLTSLLGGAGYSSVLAAAKTYALWCEGNKTVYYVYGETAYAAGGTYDGQTITKVFENRVTESSIKSKVETVVLEASYCSSKPTDLSGLFANMTNLTTIVGLENLDTSEATTMEEMFSCCYIITSIDVSNFNTSKVTNMYSMFNRCNLLTSLDVSHFNTSNVQNMGVMFNFCEKLESIDVSHFDTSNVTVFNHMFNNCSALTSIDLSNFDTSKATNMASMFRFCQSLESLDVSTFNTGKVENMTMMFYECRKITSLDLRKFNTTNVTDMFAMFRCCYALKTIYCNDSWSATSSDLMFEHCTNLVGAIPFNSSKITVEYANPTTGYFTKVELAHTIMEFSSPTATAYLGQAFTPPTLTITPSGLPVTYESSVPSVAEVDPNTGAITLVGEGSTVITASYAGDDDHYPASASYTLTVSKETPTLTFSYTESVETIGSNTFMIPTLTKPDDITVVFSSDNTKVATVDPSTGAVTLLHSGVVNITASFAGNDKYNAASASYKLTVKAKTLGLSIGGVSMTSDHLVDNAELTAALDGILTAGTVTLTANASYDLTLTLNNAKLQSNSHPIISNGCTLTLAIEGTNEMTSSTSSSACLYNQTGKVMKVSGSGQLKVKGYNVGIENLGVFEQNGAILDAVGNVNGLFGAAGSYQYILKGTLKATASTSGRASIEVQGGLVIENNMTITQPYGARWIPSEHAICDEEGVAIKTQVIITDNAVACGLAYSKNTASAKYGTTPTLPTLSNPNNLPVTYTSSNTDVATIDTDGKVKIVKPGQTVITALFEGSDAFMSGSSSYVLTVTKGDVTLAYSAATASVVFGAALTAPTLTVTPESLKNSVKFTSSNEAVARVTGSEGAVVVVGVGKSIIKVEFEGNDYYNSAWNSYELTVTAAAATMAFQTTECSTTVGASFNSPKLTTTPSSLAVKYSSSNTELATVGEESGVVVGKAEGTVTITATSADPNYSGSASYKLTITRNESGLQFANTAATATYGAAFTAPELKNEHGLTVKYESSNKTVATVDETSGKVTLLKAGETTITAKFGGNDEYAPASASYVLTVKKGKATLTFAQTECKGYVRTNFTVPALTTTPAGLTVKYTTSDANIAKVNDETGFVSLEAVGEVTITATVVSDQYEGSASYKITVSLNESGLQFAATTATATYGAAFTAPELKNEHSLTVKYESSDTKVATVDETSGKVTLLKAGETTITAKFAGNSIYAAASASYVLTVKKGKATLTFAQTECKGETGKTFTAPKLTTSPEGLKVKYSTSDANIAKVNDETGFVSLDAVGEVTITATVVSDQYEGSASYKITVSKPVVKGDVNGDGRINGTDIQALINFIVDEEDYDETFDINGDGRVNGSDIQEIINIILEEE